MDVRWITPDPPPVRRTVRRIVRRIVRRTQETKPPRPTDAVWPIHETAGAPRTSAGPPPDLPPVLRTPMGPPDGRRWQYTKPPGSQKMVISICRGIITGGGKDNRQPCCSYPT